jgi:pilus assembly protein CpaE
MLSMTSLSAVIASSNRLLRQEIRNRLNQEGILCAGEVSDLRAVTAACIEVNPQVVLLDAAYGEPVFEVIEQLARDPSLGVIVLGEDLDPMFLRGAMQAGARDFVLVRTEGQRLGEAVRRLATTLIATTPATARQSDGPGKVITVFSTKGGVGKTTIASNLAAAIAMQSGREVALIDLDLEFGGAASMFGVHAPATIVDLCRLDTEINADVVAKVMVPAKLSAMGTPAGRGKQAPITGEVRLLAAPHSPDLAAEVEGDARRRADHNYVGEILGAVVQSTPYIVLDTGPGFRETNLTALDRADVVLVITTPDILALQNTGKCLEILLHRLEYAPDKIVLLINQADTAMGVSLQEISRGLDFPVAHRLPRDAKTVIWAANCGQPFVVSTPRTKVSEGIMALAKQLVGNDSRQEKR